MPRRIAYALAALALLPASPASAQGLVCNPNPHDLFEKLDKQFGETPALGGISNSGNLIIFTVNEQSGTWTAVSVIPGGPACVLDSGEDAERQLPKPGGMPS